MENANRQRKREKERENQDACFYWTVSERNKCSLEFTEENLTTEIFLKTVAQSEKRGEEQRREEKTPMTPARVGL